MSLAVADWSGQAWLQGFNDVGLAVFSMPANELVEIKVSIPANSHGVCSEGTFARNGMTPNTMLSCTKLIVQRTTSPVVQN